MADQGEALEALEKRLSDLERRVVINEEDAQHFKETSVNKIGYFLVFQTKIVGTISSTQKRECYAHVIRECYAQRSTWFFSLFSVWIRFLVFSKRSIASL